MEVGWCNREANGGKELVGGKRAGWRREGTSRQPVGVEVGLHCQCGHGEAHTRAMGVSWHPLPSPQPKRKQRRLTRSQQPTKTATAPTYSSPPWYCCQSICLCSVILSSAFIDPTQHAFSQPVHHRRSAISRAACGASGAQQPLVSKSFIRWQPPQLGQAAAEHTARPVICVLQLLLLRRCCEVQDIPCVVHPFESQVHDHPDNTQ